MSVKAISEESKAPWIVWSPGTKETGRTYLHSGDSRTSITFQQSIYIIFSPIIPEINMPQKILFVNIIMKRYTSCWRAWGIPLSDEYDLLKGDLLKQWLKEGIPLMFFRQHER